MKKKSEEKNLVPGQIPGKTQLFPLEVFPPFLQSYVTNLHQAMGTSIDHLAAGLLFAASAAIGRTHVLELQPGYGFSGQLFLAIVGDPSTNKRAALDWPLETIFDRDHQAFLNYERQLHESSGTRRKAAKRYHRPAILITETQVEVVGLFPFSGYFNSEELIRIYSTSDEFLPANSASNFCHLIRPLSPVPPTARRFRQIHRRRP